VREKVELVEGEGKQMGKTKMEGIVLMERFVCEHT
jgi:hypothetical protein